MGSRSGEDMSSLVVGTTVPTFKAVAGEDTQWLESAERLVENARSCGFSTVHFFAAIEHDGRQLKPFARLLARMKAVGGIDGATATYWTFSICDHSLTIDDHNRLIRICTGRNLIHEFALRSGEVTHALFLDSDMTVPGDSVSKLKEMDYPIVGGNVPSYCMTGERVRSYPYKVEAHWNTAGFLMANREILRRIRWRADMHPGGAGCSDDPCFAADVREVLGYETHVRKDLVGVHKPLVPLNKRGHDLKLQGQVQ
jgi:hypothetical protein